MNQMDTTQLKQLLAKYAEGYTSLEEERILQSFFTQEGQMDADLLTWKHHFMLLKSGRDYKFDTTNLEYSLVNLIDDQEHSIQPLVRKLNLHRFLIAASIALMIGISGIIFHQIQKNSSKDTFTDPHLAYNETQKTLLYISQKLNKGTKPLSNIAKINTGTQQLRKLEKMDQSLGMLNLVSFINRSSNLKK
jgi:hypothetical protein